MAPQLELSWFYTYILGFVESNILNTLFFLHISSTLYQATIKI